MSQLSKKIEEIIIAQVNEARTTTRYRQPLIGYASAQDPLFAEMKKIIGPHVLHPSQLLPSAKTVVAFYLPFAEEIVKANRQSKSAAREWALAYVETNRLIGSISAALADALSQEGIAAVVQKATHNFNEQDLTAPWSHRSAAYVAGLGTFGINRMLITKSGCAGRYGSLVISAEIPPTPRPAEEYCLGLKNGKCRYCISHCPTGALSAEGLDKHKCYAHLLAVAEQYQDLGLCDVCGQCTIGPCAVFD